MANTPEFVWAENAVKCEQARVRVGNKATEKEVFDEYVKLAGKVIGAGYQAPDKKQSKAKKPVAKKKAK